MKIIHFGRALSLTSGVTLFMVKAANALAARGHDVAVHIHWCDEVKPDPSVTLVVDPTFQHVPEPVDVAHVHGVWLLTMVKAMVWCIWHKVPFVVSPHGSFMPRVFTHGWLKKKIVFHLLLRPLIKRAACIHCTAKAEKEACAALGFRGPFVVAPLGCDVPAEPVVRVHNEPHATRTVFFLSRLGEEKGLLNLLEAWKQLVAAAGVTRQDAASTWRLVLAGPDWKGYSAIVRAKVKELGLEGSVSFPGRVEGEQRDRLYRDADVFVLPSPMENFSAVVLDALAWGLPTIATKGTPWRELETERCGWWIDQGVEPLRAALAEAMAMSDAERRAMGARGRALALRNYSWDGVAQKLESAYV